MLLLLSNLGISYRAIIKNYPYITEKSTANVRQLIKHFTNNELNDLVLIRCTPYQTEKLYV